MSSYSKIVLVFLFITALSSCAKPIKHEEKINSLKENILISVALDYELNKDYENSAAVYESLFETHKKYIYLQKSIILNSTIKNYKNSKKLIEDNLDNYKEYEEELLQEYVLLSVRIKEYDNAVKYSKELVNKYKNTNNYNLIANVYQLIKSHKFAVKYHKKSYELEKDASVLITFSNIMDKNLNMTKEANNYILDYYNNEKFNYSVATRLLYYLQKENNTKEMIVVAKNIIKNLDKNEDKVKISKISDVLVSLYASIDIKEAIKYLEDSKDINKDEKLIKLYMATGNDDKALNLALTKYKKTKNNNLLGDISILQYETGKYNMDTLSANFEKSLAVNDDDRIQNYYGYILVDHDIDIKKGIILIKKALSKDPTNYAYQDSLAYAYYKNNECKKAYTLMKEIVNKVGLDNDEISDHWIKIQNCKENK